MQSYDDYLKSIKCWREAAEASEKAEETNSFQSNEQIAEKYVANWLDDPYNEMQNAISYTKEDLTQIVCDFKSEFELEYNENRSIKDAKSKLKDLLNLIELSEPEKTFHIESLKIIISKL